ncbi:MAG TPA: DUF1080 domain-containing protein [Stellaceae bacterium]|jgi:hypothetical protein
MRTPFFAAICCLLVALAIPLPPRAAHGQGASDGWVTLFDGKNLDQWNQIGDANWKIEDGAVVANKGSGFLVSKKPYGDFELKVEFWVNDAANSGVFIRCEDPHKIAGATGYEVNIYDQRPDPTYGTGAIVNVAKVNPMPKAGGKWNTYEITAKGPHMTAILNGVKTADGDNDKHKSGYIALQYGMTKVKDAGIVKFRLVEIKPL